METHKRLLVVGDNSILRDARDEMFVKEFNATYCPSAGDARKHVDQNGLPHLMVVNLDLPDGDGIGLCEEMQGKADLPIIAVVNEGADGPDRAVNTLQFTDDYVRKPVEARELLMRIQRILSRISNYSYAEEGPEVKVCNGLIFDHLNRRVTVDGHRRDLTPTENALLQVLVKHLGEVVTTDTLVDRVWRNGVSISDRNALRVHMHRLRTKLKRDSPDDGDLILTERGVGYLLQGR